MGNGCLTTVALRYMWLQTKHMPQYFAKFLWQESKQQPHLFCQILVINQTTCFCHRLWLVPNISNEKLWLGTKRPLIVVKSTPYARRQYLIRTCAMQWCSIDVYAGRLLSIISDLVSNVTWGMVIAKLSSLGGALSGDTIYLHREQWWRRGAWPIKEGPI